jgi:sugar phosphate isomerase/epimerase
MIGISQFILNELDIYSALKVIKSHGFKRVGMFYHSLKSEDLLSVKEFMTDLGITPINLAAAGINTPSYTAWVEDVLNAINIASELEIEKVVVIASPMGCDNASTAIMHLHKGMAEILPDAKSKGIRILIEPLHPIMRPLSILTDFRNALEFVSKYNPEEVGLVLDLFHCWWDTDLTAILEKAMPYMDSVQLADWGRNSANPLDRSFVGDGIIPISNYLNILRDNGFRGDYELEIINDSFIGNRDVMLETIKNEVEYLEDYIYAK